MTKERFSRRRRPFSQTLLILLLWALLSVLAMHWNLLFCSKLLSLILPRLL
jgi:hypothetical protein